MALEQYLDNERLNIKHLTIDSPKSQDASFNVQKEVTDRDWQNIKNEFLKNFEENSRQSYFVMTAMKILFPERDSEFSQEQLKFFKNYKKGVKQKKDASEGFEEYYKTISISSARRKRWMDVLPEAIFDKRPDKLWGKYQEILRDIRGTSHYVGSSFDNCYPTYLVMHLLFPDRTSEFDPKNDTWRRCKKELEAFREAGEWEKFSEQAMEMKVFFPSRNDEIDLDQNSWKNMRNLLQKYKKEDSWEDYIIQAMQMKIIAAKKVERTEEGFKLIMSDEKDSFDNKQSIPETRKF